MLQNYSIVTKVLLLYHLLYEFCHITAARKKNTILCKYSIHWQAVKE